MFSTTLPALMIKMIKSWKGIAHMKEVEHYKGIFERYGGMMRTNQLEKEKIFYRKIQRLIQEGHIEKVRYGYYQWVEPNNFSEIGMINRLFPDAILCMETALRYYGYSDRTPGSWHLAVSKDSGKSRFNIAYPFVKPHYVEPTLLELGLIDGQIDGHSVRIYDKERVICDCLRYRNKMDKEIFNKSIQNYVRDAGKSIPRLLEYAEALRVKKVAKDLIGVWL